MQTELEKHAAEALKLVAASASEAVKKVAESAAEAVRLKVAGDSKDHDLIQRMDEKLDALARDFRDLKDGTSDRIKKLEETKCSESEMKEIYSTRTPQWKDFSTRIEALENWKGWIIGVFSIIGIVIGLVVYIYLHDLNNQTDEIKDIKLLLNQHITNSK